MEEDVLVFQTISHVPRTTDPTTIIICEKCSQKFRLTKLCKTNCPKCSGFPDRKREIKVYAFKIYKAPKPPPVLRGRKRFTDAELLQHKKDYMRRYRAHFPTEVKALPLEEKEGGLPRGQGIMV